MAEVLMPKGARVKASPERLATLKKIGPALIFRKEVMPIPPNGVPWPGDPSYITRSPGVFHPLPGRSVCQKARGWVSAFVAGGE